MKGTLPSWLERLLGVSSAEAGEGTVWGLDHSWSWAPWVTLLFVLAVVLGIVALYFREAWSAGRKAAAGMALLRLSAIIVLLFMLAQFVLSGQRTGLPYVVLLVDDSESMGIVDRYPDKLLATLKERVEKVGLPGLSRWNLARTVLLEHDAALLHGIERQHKVKVYLASGAARELSGDTGQMIDLLRQAEPGGTASRLGAAVRNVLNDLRGTPPSALIVLSDGINTEGETLSEAAAYARRKNVPLYCVAVGSHEPVKNLKLSDLLVDEVVFVDDYVNFEFKLTGVGFAGKQAEVVLREQDQSRPLASLQVTVAADNQPQKVRLPFRPTQVGEFEYVVEVRPLPEEDPRQLDDNRQLRKVSVRKEQLRVLLVQSYPNYEFRYLKAMLERDKTIELKTVLQEADLEYAQIDPSALRVFPVRRDELFAFDVILFGDVNPALLSTVAQESLYAFVAEKGGGVVFLAGPKYTPLAYRDAPLARLFPLDVAGASLPPREQRLNQPVTIVPTDLGLASPHMQLGDNADQTEQIWKNLPPLYWLLEVGRLKPAARVLAEDAQRLSPEGRKLPILLMHYVGAGKVLFHATDETWRWRYRLGDVLFARYWVQTIRFLSRSKLLGKDRTAELAADREEYPRGEPVRLRVRFFDERLAPAADDGVVIMLEREGDQHQQVTLRRSATSRGIFEGVLPKPAVGSFHAWLASPTLEGQAPADDFVVVAPAGEFERTQMDRPELLRAAETSQGRLYGLEDVDRLLNDLPAGRQVPIESLEPIVLWNRWPVMFVFLGLLVGEWVWRKRKGLL